MDIKDIKKEFYRMMQEHNEMALATSVNNFPNVRAVNFYFDAETNIIYFSTFFDRNKVEELRKNANIAFTTIPRKGNEHVKANGVCKKSQKTVYDMKDKFGDKIEGYRELIEETGECLVLFEIHFEEYQLRLSMKETYACTL